MTVSTKSMTQGESGILESTLSYCGQDVPPDGVSYGNLVVIFQTNLLISSRGFRMKFTVNG